MTTHSNVKKKYNDNLCMDCGCSWEDGDEIPECVPHNSSDDVFMKYSKKPTSVQGRKATEPLKNETGMKAFMVARKYGAVLVYGTSMQSVQVVVRNWAKTDDIINVEYLPACNVLCQCPERIPYIEMSEPLRKRAEALTGYSFMSPSQFRAERNQK